ncbi:unnamed protein product [Closterium sp. NIES-53]
MRSLRTAQDSTGTVRRSRHSLLLACHCCSRPPFTALPVPRVVRLCHSRGPSYHLRTSDARCRAAAPVQFFDRNQPPMFITLYFIVTRLPDSLRSVGDHFLSLDPTFLTIDLLEQHLLAAETSVVAVGFACGTPCRPFFEGCSPSPLAPSYASAAAIDVPGAEEVGAASASTKRRSSKGKGGRGGGGGSGVGGGGSSGGGGGSGGGGSGGSGGGSGGFGGSGGGSGGSGGSGSGGSGGGWTGAQRGGYGGGQRQQQQRRSETPSPQQLHEWFAQRGASGGRVIRTVAIFDLDYDVILAAMIALCSSAGGDCYLCVLPDPGIEAAALGASESVLPGTAPHEASHTFTLDSGASRCFCDSTSLTPPSAPLPVRLADPSGGPVLARSSAVFPCPAVPSGSLCPCQVRQHPLARVASCRTRLFCGTTTWVTPPCHAYVACTPASLSLVFPGLCLPSRPRLPRLAFLASRGGSAPLLAPPRFPGRLLPCRLSTWTHGAKPASVDRAASATSCWSLTSTRVTPRFSPCAARGRGGEFSSDLLRDFCRGEGILQSFTLPDSPQQSGIAERRIGLVTEVARTFMNHAAAPHFLWPFAVRYAAHQLNLCPHVSLPETSPTLCWTGEVGDASVFGVWGSLLSPHLAPSIPLPLSPSPIPPALPYSKPPSGRPLPPQGPAPSGVSQVDPLPGTAPVEVAVGSRAARGAASGGAEPGGAEPGGAESEGAGSGGAEPVCEELGGAEPAGVEPGGAETRGVEHGGAESEGAESRGVESEGAESRGAEPRGTASSGGPVGASPQLSPRPEPLSPQQLREWFAQRTHLRSGAAGAGDSAAGDTQAGGAGVTAGAGGTGGTAAAGPGGARTRGTKAAGTGGVGGAGADDPTERGAAGARGAGAVGAGAGGTSVGGAGVGGAGAPASALPAPSPNTEQTGGLTERHEPASRPASPIRTGRRVPRPRPSPVPGTDTMALRPSSVALPAPPESSLLALPHPECDGARAAIVVTDPSFESTTASALVAELVEFSDAYRLDYATALIAESESASPPSVAGECALGTDVLKDRQEDVECHAAAVPRFASMLLAPEGDPDAPHILTPRSYTEAITGPYSSQWQTAMDAEMASWKSTGTYVDALPPSWANIVDGMWIFRVKQPPGSPPAFKAHYVARGFSQRQGVDYF